MTEEHHLVVGPVEHGVTRYAELLLAAAAVPEDRVVRVPHPVRSGDVADLLARLPTAVPVHVHVTDHLFGAGPEEALDVVRAIAAGRRLTVTLHDLPQASDGVPLPRRRACYAGIVDVSAAVVVSSDHEASLLAEVLGAGARTPVTVVPLAAADLPAVAPAPVGTADRDVAVLGFVYPGKGHTDVLDALADLPADVGLRVVGRASPGHQDLIAGLQSRAEVLGRRVHVDGWVPDAQLPSLLRAVAVPVFAPRHVSASASLATWAAAGRRVVATRSRYTTEVERRTPGSLLLVPDSPAGLAAGIEAALTNPSMTVLATKSTWTAAEAARRTFASLVPV